jgi:hypothetical protein
MAKFSEMTVSTALPGLVEEQCARLPLINPESKLYHAAEPKRQIALWPPPISRPVSSLSIATASR